MPEETVLSVESPVKHLRIGKSEDLVGRKFHRFTVLSFVGTKRKWGTTQRVWLCQCDCGNIVEQPTGRLAGTQYKSCGCLKHSDMPRNDLTGQEFGRLVALKFVGKEGHISFWLFRCSCGNEKILNGSSVRNGNTQSCGCLQRETVAAQSRTHGDSGSPEYRAWKQMFGRCENKNCRDFHSYGGRGIKVCKRWANYSNFLADMGRRPSPQYSLERRNVNGNYSSANCRWGTKKEQAQNKRNTHRVTFQGRTECVSEWARIYGIKQSLLNRRLRDGWDFSVAVGTPSNSGVQLYTETQPLAALSSA